ncbi:MAG TPA: hypothetical protein VH596_03845 [Terriglobales bacterium]
MGRILGFVGLLISAGIIFYLTTRQAQTVSQVGGGSTIQSAEVLTGVKGDLLSIANAERQYSVTEGKYGSFDDLVSTHYISIKNERPPYSYDIEATSSGFRVTATRSGPGSPSQLWIDENMEIQSSN